jgi:lipopolysaccharide export system permease protein
MKILDRYLIKQFIQTILFGLLAFTLIFIVVDMMENLDDFIDQDVAWMVVINYYLMFSPEIIRLITPVSVLFAALFTTGKLSNLNEITAIKASGVSMYRFMLPLTIVTLMISLISIYFGGYVVPKANKIKLSIERDYLKKGIEYAGSNIFFQDAKNKIVNISFFDENNSAAIRVGIQEFDNENLTKMTRRIDANRMAYDSSKKIWTAFNGSDRIFYENNEKVEYFFSKEIKDINFVPTDLAFKQQKPQEMNLDELEKLINDKTKAGNDPTTILIEYHSRYSFAFASFIVVLFGMPLSANKRKGGLALQFGINILITFIYLGMMKIVEAFGKNGALDPILTAWFVNILFMFGAFINISKVKQ